MKTCLGVALLLLLARPVGATRALPVSLEALARNAELVVEGDAGPGQSFRIDGRIFTRIEVRVRGVWKGDERARSVSIILRGGIVDGIGQRVDGEAVVEEGDHTVLFLRYDDDLAGYRPIALEQGAFRVRDRGDLRAARLEAVDLPSFESRVRGLVRAP
ncbi:MAG: hypothetical protein ACAI38_00365 [Myxococcota bacterium]|nr:hypothetical protein [Myxococcota bacterium]